MSTWPPACYQRATAYVTDPSGRLLVFDHVDNPDAGTQVPAGGIHPGEKPEIAALREVAEESGVTTARLVRKLGESWYVAPAGLVPAGLEEQVHHAFHLRLDDPPEESTWVWDDCDGGSVPLHRFAFRWVDLDEASSALHPMQAMWVQSLRSSVERT